MAVVSDLDPTPNGNRRTSSVVNLDQQRDGRLDASDARTQQGTVLHHRRAAPMPPTNSVTKRRRPAQYTSDHAGPEGIPHDDAAEGDTASIYPPTLASPEHTVVTAAHFQLHEHSTRVRLPEPRDQTVPLADGAGGG